MKRDTIVLLYGGKSGEHEVSLRSAASMLSHMDRDRWEPIGVAIDHDGRWYLQDPEDLVPGKASLTVKNDPERLVSVVPGVGLEGGGKKIDCACVFPILHGTYGEDGTVQGLLELAGIPYTGAGVAASAVGMDKEMTKRVWMQAGLPVVPFFTVRREDYLPENRSNVISAVEKNYGFPVFVKPVRLGSSVGINRVSAPGDLDAAMEEALQYDTRVMIEPQISGRELECAVLGNTAVRAYGPGEVAPSHGFYSYEAKYIDPDGAILIIPAKLPPSLSEAVRDLAVRAYTVIQGEGMSRVDFFLENETGRVLLNEINTIPGFTSISMFPMMCESGGLSYSDLISELICLGIERFNERRQLRFRYDG